MRRNCLVKVAAGCHGRKIHLIAQGEREGERESGDGEKRGRRGWMVAYSSLLSSRWIISAMWPEDYDALLVHSTCIFTCLTYAEYQRTFKYLQRFDGTTTSFIGTDTVGRLIILIRADVPRITLLLRDCGPLFLKLGSVSDYTISRSRGSIYCAMRFAFPLISDAVKILERGSESLGNGAFLDGAQTRRR